MPSQPAQKEDPLKGKKTGKWTKYGGPVYGLKKEKIVDTWYCQLCGDEMPAEWKPFLYELYPDDFIRVCNSCMQEQLKNKKVVTYRKKVTVIKTTARY